MTLKVYDLFAGIGGFSLGFHSAGGFETVGFAEKEPYCVRVLEKAFPGTPIHDDVCTLDLSNTHVDVLTGGFPCQDISLNGKRAGLAGERSGLWHEYKRLIAECNPSWIVAENVAALRHSGLDQILADLDALGYDAEWHCLPASFISARHRRDRVWVIAYRRGRFIDAVLSDCYTPGLQGWGPQFLPECAAEQLPRPRGALCPEPALPNEDGGSLNPDWLEWHMGFPIGHTACDLSATPLSRRSSSGSSPRPSSKPKD